MKNESTNRPPSRVVLALRLLFCLSNITHTSSPNTTPLYLTPSGFTSPRARRRNRYIDWFQPAAFSISEHLHHGRSNRTARGCVHARRASARLISRSTTQTGPDHLRPSRLLQVSSASFTSCYLCRSGHRSLISSTSLLLNLRLVSHILHAPRLLILLTRA